ncbi:glycosyltransferase family 2 protein [Fundidesulfovibrio soli]|uniref:glycosyltransferase family 2 protein n=1 Tax=Fundidesulfovibrio soli TaxID=2922716 RepID=UPI001FAFD4FE|nr:glycosyltransferase family 2 protein [Fundidesulfovibrio soli]
MTATGKKLSVVVPCFNEEPGLAELHRRVGAACASVAGSVADYEIVLVDDGSSDGTWRAMQALAERDPRVLGVRLSRNYGHQIALTAGLNICSGDLILIIDADLQDPPELLPEMLAKVEEGCEVVYGRRRSRSGETYFKKATAKAFYRLLDRMVSVNIPRDTGDFRLITRKVLEALNSMPEQHRFIRGMVSWVGFRQAAIEYDRDSRFAGETKYPFRKMLNFAFDAITAFSVVPLKMATVLGFCMGVASLLGILYTVIGWLSGGTVQGWTSTMLAVLSVGSVQLIAIGIFGEYIGRMYMESKRRPLYIVDTTTREPR